MVINSYNIFCMKKDRKSKTEVNGICSYLIFYSNFLPISLFPFTGY